MITGKTGTLKYSTDKIIKEGFEMYSWCDKCKAVAFDGICSEHGRIRPISTINALDVRPLTKFEKQFLNDRLEKLRLGDGIFLVYDDRIYHRKVVALDKAIVDFKLLRDGMHVNPYVEGEVEGMGIDALFNANESRINKLVEITKTISQWELNSDNKNAIISFSGGKDSVILAHLLEEFKLKKVFIDTKIEFPETYKFIKQLREKGWDIDIVQAESSFFSLYKEKGYPNYGNRWCCKTQKFNPFARYIKENFSGEEVLVFSGERRCGVNPC